MFDDDDVVVIVVVVVKQGEWLDDRVFFTFQPLVDIE